MVAALHPKRSKSKERSVHGRISVDLHACAQEVHGVVHLAAAGPWLGLESELVHGDAHRTLDSDASAALDAPEAAEELCGEIHTPACPLLQTASLRPEIPKCFVNYVKTQLRLDAVWMCLCCLV